MDAPSQLSRADRAAFGLAIFLGAFLLFQMQPLIGKYLLPWFGGAAGVWTICLLFFQCLLLAGYLYAHLLTRYVPPRIQALVHGLILLAALTTLPLAPDTATQPNPTGSPVGQLLVLLTATVGLPFMVLAATGPLLQAWFSRLTVGQAPWRFYALSNAGSLLALISYPFLVEPYWSRSDQSTIWGWGLALFVVACGYTTWRSSQAPTLDKETQATDADPPPSRGTWALWLLLPACGTALLMATSSKICLDVAPVPFLWVLPLALYLLSFIVAFDNPKWYSRTWAGLALGASWLALAGLFLVRLREAGAETDAPAEWPLAIQVAIHGLALFIMCLICHGELFRLRPRPVRLTQFYLAIAGGGALGGLAVGLGAPAVFNGYWEYPIAAWLCGLLMVITCYRDPTGRRAGRLLAAGMVGFSLLLLAQTYYQLSIHDAGWGTARWRGRNFYGVLTLYEGMTKTPAHASGAGSLPDQAFLGSAGNFSPAPLPPSLKATNRVIIHGNIVHGLQFISPGLATMPTIYYGPSGAVGRLLMALPSPRRVGVVGLGVGTLATYARPSDVFRFYEINPTVVHLARTQFTYLRDCQAQEKPVLLGDARLVMQREKPQGYDVLVLDAFSSDAIPVHLLTQEAFDLYQKHLNSSGPAVIAVHITNRHLDLHPVLSEAARTMGWHLTVYVQPRRFPTFGESSSTWALFSKNEALLKNDVFDGLVRLPAPKRRVQLWTDEYASLLPILK